MPQLRGCWGMSEIEDFPCGAHGQLFGLAAKPELNEQYVVSHGKNPDNPERLQVVLATGSVLSIKPANLRPAELLPGARVAVVALESAAGSRLNGQRGEVHSWTADRWIVELGDAKERKSLRSSNLVMLPTALPPNKRKADTTNDEDVKRIKAADLRDLDHGNEEVIARALLRNLREFPLIAMKCVCVLATKQQITVMHELAQHMTEKHNDGLLRRPVRPGEKVKGIEDMDAMEQIRWIAEKKIRSLAGMCKINYCDIFGFIKMNCKEPKFHQSPLSR